MDIVLIALKLTAPETAEIHRHLAVGIVAEGAHVDAVASSHWSWLRDERACGIVSDGCSPVEHVVAVFEREVHNVFLHLLAVAHAGSLLFGICRYFLYILLYVAVPELASCPWNILLTEHATMVGDGARHRVAVDREDMIVLHDVLVAVVVFNVRRLPVVAGIDINLAVENVN